MPISIFEMFRVGVGPSSSHTVGPMRAARRFAHELSQVDAQGRTVRIVLDLMGSLGATGKGHVTDQACLLGLMGYGPEQVDTSAVPCLMRRVRETKRLMLEGGHEIAFDMDSDIVFSAQKVAAFHTNAMQLRATDAEGGVILERRYYSVGGGFIVCADENDFERIKVPKRYEAHEGPEVPFPYRNASELVEMTIKHNKTIAQLVRANERTHRTDEEIDAELDRIWVVMQECLDRGLTADGVLPGPMRVKRRSKALAARLVGKTLEQDPMLAVDWVNAWGLAVAEENACGGRIVTCPTNGAAGVIPAVIKYMVSYIDSSARAVRDFMLTAGAVGMLYKENASISGAEVGCQGEVGVACSMAAAGLAAIMGGSVCQVENAAEIGMEHHLGLTCDPVAGQVQIPCIERNAVAAVKAINAARMALAGDGTHVVSLDQVMRTMFETGRDMQSKYKETSQGGLALSIVEC